MALDLDKILEFIETSNYQGLESHFAKHKLDSETLLPPNYFTKALGAFLKSDAQHLTNSYKVLESLKEHTANPNRKNKYKISEEHSVLINIFNIFTKLSKEKPLSTEDKRIIKHFANLNAKQALLKFENYKEKTSLRKIYKTLDSLIEKEITYKIRYPKNTSFIRKLLRMPPKQSKAELMARLEDHLDNMILQVEKSITSDKRFRDNHGKFILTDAELSSLVYERLSIKCRKQLKLDQSSIDEVLGKANLTRLGNTLDQESKGQEIITAAIDYAYKLNNAHPLFLLDFSKLTPALPALDNPTKEQEVALEQANARIMAGLRKYLATARDEVENYKDKPGREDIVIKMVDSLINNSDNVAGVPDLSDAILTDDEIKKLQEIKSSAQKILFDRLLKSHVKKSPPRSQLTAFEKQALALLKRKDDLGEDEKLEYTKEEKELLARFFKHATSNLDFNKRLARVLKTNDDFTKNYLDITREVHGYTYKTSNLDQLLETADTIETILYKLDHDGPESILDSEKISLLKLGQLIKFVGSYELLDLIEENELHEQSDGLTKLIMTYQRCESVHDDLSARLLKNATYKNGDIVVNKADKVRSYFVNKPGITAMIRDFFTKHMHTGSIFIDGDNNITISEIQDDHTLKETGEINTLTAESFRIHPLHLIHDEDVREELMKYFDVSSEEELSDKLQEMYRDAYAEVHEEISKNELTFDYNRGKRALIADLIPGGHKGKQDIKSWAKDVLQSPNFRISDNEGGHIICSEFTAKLTVLALVKLEQQLVDQVGLKQTDIIDMPLNDKEDLSKIHPTRLIKQLLKHNAVKKVDRPELIGQIVR